jgi:tellurite methyltransferase
VDKKYWEKYYKTGDVPERASFFAEYIIENHLSGNEKIIELGCGNGRDSIFFAKNGFEVLAIDQCKEEIDKLSKENDLPNIKFVCDDFTKLGDIGPFGAIYSRFTLHAISKDEDRVIKWASKNLKIGGKILIEARGKKNELYGKGIPVEGQENAYIYEDHYRRFIDIDELSNKLSSSGLKILISKEDRGFAPFKDTDYIFIRVIAIKE